MNKRIPMLCHKPGDLLAEADGVSAECVACRTKLVMTKAGCAQIKEFGATLDELPEWDSVEFLPICFDCAKKGPDFLKQELDLL